MIFLLVLLLVVWFLFLNKDDTEKNSNEDRVAVSDSTEDSDASGMEVSEADEDDESEALITGVNTTTSANIYNGGFLATDASVFTLFYRGDDHYLYRSDPDLCNEELLLQKTVNYINCVDGWLYLYNATDACVVRITTDGDNYEVLYQGTSHEVNVYGNWIYFCVDNDGIYRMEKDGSNVTKLASGSVWYLNVTDNGLYYEVSTDRSLCSCGLDGSDQKILLSEGVYETLAYGDSIYYAYGADTRYLYRYDLTTGTSTQISSYYTRWLNTDGTYFYYTSKVGEDTTNSNLGYGYELYYIPMDGGTQQSIRTDYNGIQCVTIQSGYICYYAPATEQVLIYQLYD